jgi:hypothetical protein
MELTKGLLRGRRSGFHVDRKQIQATFRGLNRRISNEFKADVQGFFGSRARGDAREDSDLDVLVRFHDEASVYDLVELGDFLEDVFRCNVDIVSVRALSEKPDQHILDELVHV